MESNVRADSWFSSVKTGLQCAVHGVNYIGAIKTAHSGFPKKYLFEKLKDLPGGTQLVMEGVHSKIEEKLIAIGYKYLAKKVLFYIATANAGSTRPGQPYEMKFGDEYGNLESRFVPRPDVVAMYHGDANTVDVLNQLRQNELGLESKWVTQDGHFRIATGALGMTVVDVYRLSQHHGLISSSKLLCLI